MAESWMIFCCLLLRKISSVFIFSCSNREVKRVYFYIVFSFIFLIFVWFMAFMTAHIFGFFLNAHQSIRVFSIFFNGWSMDGSFPLSPIISSNETRHENYNEYECTDWQLLLILHCKALNLVKIEFFRQQQHSHSIFFCFAWFKRQFCYILLRATIIEYSSLTENTKCPWK